jgi:hypothetical protein
MASGGKALVFAPHVVNSGRISAVDGQVIMGAGEQVYLATDTSGIRGLDVAVSAPMRWVFTYFQVERWASSTPGNFGAFQDGLNAIVFPEMAARAATVGYSVVNDGLVKADHGNITLMSRSRHPERCTRGLDRAEQSRRLDPAARVGERHGLLWRRYTAGFAALLDGRFADARLGQRHYGDARPDGYQRDRTDVAGDTLQSRPH